MPDFKIVRKGYDTFEVKRYIEGLQKQIDQLKDKENYINKAIISAEIAASDMKARAERDSLETTSKAKAEAEKIVAAAKEEAEKLLSKTHNQIALIRQRESDKLNDLKLFIEDKIDYLGSFKADYAALAKKYFETPNEDEYNSIVESLKNVTNLIDSFEKPNDL